MAANYTVSATFTAIDKMSAKFATMQRATSKFATKAQANFARIEMAGRRLEKRVGSMLGKLGKLGLGFGGLMIAQHVAKANVELDQSLASLQAITGATNDQMVDYATELEKVSKAQKIFGADTGKVFEMVGSAKPELLASAEALGKVSEQAIILSKAGKLEITDSVTALTSSLNQFGKGAESASKFTDVLATAQQKGAGNIQFLSQAMVNAGGTSRAFGNSFEDTVAILEGFAKAGVPASEAGTQLSGILSKLSKAQNKDFNPQFTKATDIIDNLAKANLSYTELMKLTDVRGAKWLTTIINQNEEVQRLTGNLYEQDNAIKQANTQTATLGQLWKEVVAQFQNSVTTTDQNNKSLNTAKDLLRLLADNMDKVIGFVIKAIKAFIAYKAVMFSVVVAQKSLLAAMAIAKFARFVMIIIKIAKAKGIWAAAQWALNVALNANPIGLIIMAVAALAAGVVWLISKWSEIVNWIKTSDNWFAKLIRGALKPIIWLFQKIGQAWQWVKGIFKSGKIGGFFKRIGQSIMNFVLAPLEAIIRIVNKLTNGKVGGEFLAKMDERRLRLAGEDEANNVTEINSTKTVAAQESIKREERLEKQQAEILIKREQSVELETSIPDGFPVSLSPTF